MYDFDQAVDRRGTTSIKWNFQNSFGQQDGLLPFWIADTDFPTVPEVIEALKKRCDHPVFGYSDPLPSTFQAIQGWWSRRYGWTPDTEWMFMTCGVVTGIYFALDALVAKGDKVLTFTPVYDPFFAAIKNKGRGLLQPPQPGGPGVDSRRAGAGGRPVRQVRRVALERRDPRGLRPHPQVHPHGYL